MASKSIAPIEIGSFTASNPQKTEFIGSSSGVFFVNTVFRAFARSAYNSNVTSAGISSNDPPQQDPGSVDSRLVDPDTPVQVDHETAGMRIHIENETNGTTRSKSYGVKGHGLGIPPDQDSARDLLMLYLRNWHPLFPFLHGPTLLEMIGGLYEADSQKRRSLNLRTRLCNAIICQCVFNIAALDKPCGALPSECRLESPTKLLALLGYIASNHDTVSLQALVAAQLYLVSTMSLRAASTIGGTISRVMFHAGFHRCPFRYPQLPPQECDLRKRIFFSAYVLDRYLSQALGHPLGIQDSDFDVCIPGMDELHMPVKPRPQMTPAALESDEGVLAHLPRGHSGRESRPEDSDSSKRSDENSAAAGPDNNSGEASSGSQILGHYVLYCRLTGQALEMFHVSLQNRSINTEKTMELQSNVHAWWNSLPQELQDEYTGGKIELTSTFTFFFAILYNHLLLLTNRPFLSLPPKSLEFKSSLQTCVTASRQIITTSRHQFERDLIVSWPGMLSAIWMGGLVLSFACTLKLYPFSKAQKEIDDSVRGLLAMDKKWNNARHCAEALRSLLENLKIQYNEKLRGLASPPSTLRMSDDRNPTPPPIRESVPEGSLAVGGYEQPRKRRRTNNRQQARGNDNIDNQGRGSVSGGRSTQPLERTDQDIGQEFDAETYQMPSVDNFAMFPILEYTGPDLSFSNGQFGSMDDFDYIGLPVSEDLYSNTMGAFGNIGWEAMANGSGNVPDWSGRSTTTRPP